VEEAYKAVDDMLVTKIFGDAGDPFVIRSGLFSTPVN
jgi:hypothetical protein